MSQLRLAADENFNGHIVRAIRRRYRALDLVRVQDVLPEGTADPDVLEWAASESRAVLTHDLATMVGFAYRRLELALPMTGLIAVPMGIGIGIVLADLALVLELTSPAEIDHQVLFIPF